MHACLLLPEGRGSSRRLRRQRWAAQRPQVPSDAPRRQLLLPVPGRSPASRLLSNNLQPTEETGFCGSGLVRECCSSADEYSSDVQAFSRTSPLPPSLLRDSATSKTWWRLPQSGVYCATVFSQTLLLARTCGGRTLPCNCVSYPAVACGAGSRACCLSIQKPRQNAAGWSRHTHDRRRSARQACRYRPSGPSAR